MSHTIQMAAKQRTEVGRGNTRKICREQGLVPGIIYGADKENLNIYLVAKDINHAMQKPEFYANIINLDVDGKKETVVLKDSQIHPDKGDIRHIDFMRIKSNEAMKISIPLVFIGEDKAPGVKAGGIATHLETSVEIKCLPKELPEKIEVDVSKIKLDGKVHLSELVLPKGVELSHKASGDHDSAVFVIHSTRNSVAEDDAGSEGDA
jgi:large subunit ribosomal protein L25